VSSEGEMDDSFLNLKPNRQGPVKNNWTDHVPSGLTEKNGILGHFWYKKIEKDHTEPPKAPRLRRRVLHGKIPLLPVIRALRQAW